MLAPHERQLLLDLIRPPIGYQFDCGFGTTFTLDLYTLLAAPLSLSLYDRDCLDDALSDPLVVLDSMRQCAERLVIFCQAGYIQVPRKFSRLLHFLEPMVVEVQAPGGGVFHPKLWLLRYIANGQPTLFRLVNLSRNLTADRSWDLALRLDGQLGEQSLPANQPLGMFVDDLPGLAVQPVSPRVKNLMDSLRKSLDSILFSPPAPFYETANFYSFGNRPISMPLLQDTWDRMMIVSPFLSESFLERITQRSRVNVLISNGDSLSVLSSDIRQRFQDIYYLDEMTEPENDPEQALSESIELSGLHAKLFVAEAGDQATWLLGSANATEAAFSNNVEFMVGLRGAKNQVGIDRILNTDTDDISFMALLRRHEPSEGTEKPDDISKRLDDLTNEIRRWLVNLRLRLQVMPGDDGAFVMELVAEKKLQSPRSQFEISCWPITPPSTAMSFDLTKQPLGCQFKNIDLLGLTPFIAFAISTHFRRQTRTTQFVMRLPIEGLPPGREQLLLVDIIKDSDQFLRYLRMLIGGLDGFQSPGYGGGGDQGGEFIWKSTAWEDLALLEDLVRALSRSPEHTIDQIGDLIAQLKLTSEGQALIPPEFETLWQIIAQARQELR